MSPPVAAALIVSAPICASQPLIVVVDALLIEILFAVINEAILV